MLDTGMFVISVNAIDDATIKLIGKIGAARNAGLISSGVPAWEKANNDRTDYLRLDWKEIAKRQGVHKTPYQ